jgi:predicted RNA-binding protein with PIN domain
VGVTSDCVIQQATVCGSGMQCSHQLITLYGLHKNKAEIDRKGEKIEKTRDKMK